MDITLKNSQYYEQIKIKFLNELDEMTTKRNDLNIDYRKLVSFQSTGELIVYGEYSTIQVVYEKHFYC